MKRSIIKQVASVAMAAAVFALPLNQASAFSMDEMINDYTASTVDPNARITLDGRRGFISGGSLRVRFENKANPELYNITLPSFKADCNGMDMNLGSLSWISADEFMDAARQMASPQVLIYALSLALNQMCGPCAQLMSDLQDKLNEYSGLLKQSCEELGTALYDKTGQKEKIAKMSQDFWDRAQANTGEDAAATEGKTVQQMLDAGEQEELSTNLVWDHLEDMTINGWLADVAGENVAKEMIMSLSGTDITDASGANNEDEIKHNPKAPVEISLKQLIDGGKIFGLKCQDNYDKCLDVAEAEIFENEPMADKFFEMLDPQNDDSIPAKFAIHYDGISLTQEELAFMVAAQRHFDIQKTMHSLAMSGNNLPSRTAKFVAELMAIEITLAFMLEYVETASIVMGSIDNKDDIQEINPFELSAGYRKEAETLRQELSEKIAADADISTTLKNALDL